MESFIVPVNGWVLEFLEYCEYSEKKYEFFRENWENAETFWPFEIKWVFAKRVIYAKEGFKYGNSIVYCLSSKPKKQSGLLYAQN